jgi:hypothetical protein
LLVHGVGKLPSQQFTLLRIKRRAERASKTVDHHVACCMSSSRRERSISCDRPAQVVGVSYVGICVFLGYGDIWIYVLGVRGFACLADELGEAG